MAKHYLLNCLNAPNVYFRENQLNWNDAFRSTDEVANNRTTSLVEKSWQETNQASPNGVNFGITIPIRNEGTHLWGVLSALHSCSIPVEAKVDYYTVVNFEDASEIEIDLQTLWNFLNTVCTDVSFTQLPFYENLASKYPGLEIDCLVGTSKFNNTRFFVIGSSVPGKARALNIANDLSTLHGHEVTFNVDANSYPFTSSLAYLLREILINPNNAVVSTNSYSSLKDIGLLKRLIYTINNDSRDYTPNMQVPEDVLHLNGSLFVWRNRMISEIGGFSENCVEDYTTALILDYRGYIVKFINDFLICSYESNSMYDLIRTTKRHYLGISQFLNKLDANMDPSYLRDKLAHQFYFGLSLPKMMQAHYNRYYKGSSYLKLPLYLRRLLAIEVGRLLAEHEIKCNPKILEGSGWIGIKSTKT